MKKLLAILLFSVAAVTSSANAFFLFGWGGCCGGYGYGYPYGYGYGYGYGGGCCY